MTHADRPPTALADRPLPVPDALRPWITEADSVTAGDRPAEPLTHAPDTATKLVVRAERDGRRDALVVGPRTRASYHSADGKHVVSCVRMSLAPGTARPLLGVPAADLVGRVVPLRDLPAEAARRLSYEITDREPDELVARLTEVLPTLLPASGAARSRQQLLRAAVDALSVRTGRVPGQVKAVAQELAVSERQLRNLFTEGVGLSPKHYARIDRVRAVLAHATTVSWAELAVAAGYYDQSHMSADFRALMGVPPRSFVTGRLPGPRPCQAIDRR
ncbi:helix-turn-helix domain-containing protein [Streptomyces sp. NPDC047072]|uniref:AraC family transcriptional regulator n=1 Tax=Streptomyces sp. NPDC047072 TaxID=3154809 RepID=UPI0034051A8E